MEQVKSKDEEIAERDALLKAFRGDFTTLSKSEQRAILREQANLLLRTKAVAFERERERVKRTRKAADKIEAMVRMAERRLTELPADRRDSVHVYVIGSAGNPIKIGIAADPQQRRKDLQTGYPHTLRVYSMTRVETGADARRIEREAHAKLSEYRLRGEWFDYDPYEASELVAALVQTSTRPTIEA